MMNIRGLSPICLIALTLLFSPCSKGASERDTGYVDGAGKIARFAYPSGIATDSTGNVYVADTSNHVIRKITSAGVVSTLAGLAGAFGSADGIGAAARFMVPMGIATDSAGNVYVADTNNKTIRKITPAGVVSTLAGTAGAGDGSVDGIGAAARFGSPRGVATDRAGNVYVTDSVNCTIRKITPAGEVTTLAGAPGPRSSTDGIGAAARFNVPTGIATDSAGNLYVTDTNGNTVRKITPNGTVTTLAGTAYSGHIGGKSVDGTGTAARFVDPRGIATDSAGNVYVAEFHVNTIRKIAPSGIVTTLAGKAGKWGNVDATGAAARFSGPTGVATDDAGNVYVADFGNSSIRKITPAGAVTRLAGPAAAANSAGNTVLVVVFILGHFIPVPALLMVIGGILELLLAPVALFVGHPERIAIVAGLLFAAFFWKAFARHVRVQPLIVAAALWTLYVPWEWAARDFDMRFDLFLVSPILVLITAWGLIAAFRGPRVKAANIKVE